MKEKLFIIGIYDNQNNLTEKIEVEAETENEAEAIAWENYLDRVRNNYYASSITKEEVK